MPRKRTDEFYRQRIFSLVENELPRLSDKAICERLKEAGRQYQRTDWPSERTVGRIRKEHLARAPKERRQYGYFRWPESMEDGSLPWEAAPAALELLRSLHRFHRPPIRLAKWFWRVTQAAPGTSAAVRFRAATQLAASEAIGARGSEEIRKVEWYLAFQPWRSKENLDAYQQAQTLAGAEPIILFDRARVNLEGEEDAIIEAADMFAPGYGPAIVEYLKMGLAERAEQGEEADNEQ